MIERAAQSAADLVFLDLEDAVAPNRKAESRPNVVWAFNELDWGGKTRAVRINNVETEYAHQDIIEVVEGAGANLDMIIVPKIKTAEDVRWVETLLKQLETRLRLERPIALEVLIEDVSALIHVDAIARSTPRLEALIFGPGDFAASQGVDASGMTEDIEHWAYARNRVVIAARAAGIDAIDGPFDRFREPERYRGEARRAAALGYVGKWAIHPSQIAIANDVFSPDAAAVAKAREIVTAYREAMERGEGAIVYDDKMLDFAAIRPLEERLQRADEIARRFPPTTDGGKNS
jgi:citrate lyase subunit beta/citryl-CoA lyase